MEKLLITFVLLTGLAPVIFSQSQYDNWKHLAFGIISLMIPHQDYRQVNGEKSFVNTFIKSDTSECIKDSLGIKSVSGQIFRCSLNVLKSCLTKVQVDSLFPILKSQIMDLIISERPNITIGETELKPDLSDIIVLNYTGIKEYMTILVWFCQDYIISASLEDVSNGHCETQFFLENFF